jgi:hypothetical protein
MDILSMTESERKKANISDAEFKQIKADAEQEEKILALLAGKTVRIANYVIDASSSDGYYVLEFTDGSKAEFNATGDDATFVHMNFTPSKKGGK